jgi:transposase-like protein
MGLPLSRRRCDRADNRLSSPKRNAAAARRFFRKALGQPHTVNPRTVTVDKNAAYPVATKAMKRAGELWRFAKLRQVKFLNKSLSRITGTSNGWFVLGWASRRL